MLLTRCREGWPEKLHGWLTNDRGGRSKFKCVLIVGRAHEK